MRKAPKISHFTKIRKGTSVSSPKRNPGLHVLILSSSVCTQRLFGTFTTGLMLLSSGRGSRYRNRMWKPGKSREIDQGRLRSNALLRIRCKNLMIILDYALIIINFATCYVSHLRASSAALGVIFGYRHAEESSANTINRLRDWIYL